MISATINGSTYYMQDRLLSAGPIRRPMGGVIGSSENANATISLDNSDGSLSALFNPPPLGKSASISWDGGTFDGVVASVDISDTVSVGIEAGGRVPLTRNIPLISTTRLSSYTIEASIPIVYGTVTMRPVQQTSDRKRWLISAHPVAGVDSVLVDGVEVAFELQNLPVTIDTGDVVMAVLILPQAVPENSTIRCNVRGKINPRTGGAFSNPADVVWDIIANICGIPLDYSELSRFRADTATDGLTVSGVIAGGRQTARSAVDEIAASCGAIWSGQAEGVMIQYLGATAQTPAATINARDIDRISLSAEVSDIATSLTVRAKRNHALDQSDVTAVLSAQSAVIEYGAAMAELPAPWIETKRAAEIIGRRYLAWRCVPQWRITVETSGNSNMQIQPGEWITLNHPMLPGGTVTAMAVDSEVDLSNNTVTFTLYHPAQTAPLINLISATEAV